MSQSSPTRQNALQLLSQGVAPSQAAAALGVSESQISQYLQDEDFSAALQAQRASATAEDLAYDEKLDRVEEEFLGRIEQKAAFANLQQSLQAFKILNTAKRRKDSRIAPQSTGSGTVVNITIPIAVIPQYVTNSKNEIVEVEGKTMVSANPKRLEEMLRERGSSALQSETPIGLTKAQRAEETLQILNPRPQRKPVKRALPEVSDLL